MTGKKKTWKNFFVGGEIWIRELPPAEHTPVLHKHTHTVTVPN
jgi:hypothetical protein